MNNIENLSVVKNTSLKYEDVLTLIGDSLANREILANLDEELFLSNNLDSIYQVIVSPKQIFNKKEYELHINLLRQLKTISKLRLITIEWAVVIKKWQAPWPLLYKASLSEDEVRELLQMVASVKVFKWYREVGHLKTMAEARNIFNQKLLRCLKAECILNQKRNDAYHGSFYFQDIEGLERIIYPNDFLNVVKESGNTFLLDLEVLLYASKMSFFKVPHFGMNHYLLLSHHPQIHHYLFGNNRSAAHPKVTDIVNLWLKKEEGRAYYTERDGTGSLTDIVSPFKVVNGPPTILL